MPETAKEAAAASLGNLWWRYPIYDPAPPWLFQQFGEQVQRELMEEQLRTQQAVLQAVADSLGRQADIVAKQAR
jgi:hypothetical protein